VDNASTVKQPKLAVPPSVHKFWLRNEKFLAAEFFFAGFIFDIVTLQRIDDWLNIAQQGLFIAIILGFLVLYTRRWEPSQAWPPYLRKAWGYNLEAFHFMFGSLLSGFTVFYFKSSSIFVSFGFLLVLIGLLVANELKRFKELEIPFKWALFALCLLSYLLYVVPIVLGYIGLTTFLISWVLTLVSIALIVVYLRKQKDIAVKIEKVVVLPSTAILAVFAIAYWLQLVPPVPLSIKYMGIYHQVQRTPDGRYELLHQKPWWKFWQNGDQVFMASPGDKIFCYFRLYSPAKFKDEIRLHWLKKDPLRGWESQDKVPLRVSGGREEGFRGFGTKANYEPGNWRVQVETTEGREIGRVYFEINTSPPSEERQFEIESQ
jgi:hypothetical protein